MLDRLHPLSVWELPQQGILNGLFVGVGTGGGTMLGGLLIGSIGMRVTYRLFAAFLALIILLFLGCQWQQGGSDESEASYRAVPDELDDPDE
ncbi:hypothetical protein OS493_039470 [Desmophyllum pertusum]|uniref:Uncharacterized protein n=1 Tax=Desmophyllum pertusum TaxID=174260 RepID=A0A9W9Z6B8_9CNID|nr:hypothetical protein OS493_039470 [Desmophyllum pertusum]